MRHLERGLLMALFAVSAAAAEAGQPGLQDLLSYDLAELMNVEVVSASKELEPALQAPASVRIITAEQIRERGYLTLEEALAGLPGFQFRNISGFNSYVFLRGLPSQNNLILLLVDGVQINEINSGGFYAGAQHNLANVKRIEVVYGPASALYGTNAVSGIINIITRDPADIRGGEAGALAGDFNTRGLDFSYGSAPEGGPAFSFSAAARRTDKYPLGGAAGDNNWSPGLENGEEDWSFDGKVAYRAFTFGAVVQDKLASIATNEKTTGTDLVDAGTRWHIRFINSYLKHVYAPSPDWSVETRLYYRDSTVLDDTVRRVYSTVCSTCGQQGEYRPNGLGGLESRLTFRPLTALELTAGLVAERENVAKDFSTTYSGDPLQRPPSPGTPDMTSSDLLSLYVQARYDLSASLRFNAGIRYDHSSSYDTQNTPRAALVYNRGRLTAKLMYAEAFRAPRPWDYSYGAGNTGLGPEEMRSVELAGVYAFSQNLRADASLYRNKLRGLLQLDTVADRWVNSGSIETLGLGAQLEAALGHLKARAGYTLQNSEYGDGSDVEEIAEHGATAGLFYAFSRHVKLDVGSRWQGRRRNPKTIAVTGSSYVGSYVVTDAALSFYESSGLTARLLAKNLLDERYYHTSNRPPDRYRQPGRQLLLQVSHAFGR